MEDSATQSVFARPVWAAPLVAVVVTTTLLSGPLFIDDAYITFRYAENIAAGRGFVYNREPVLGVTAPLYCLLLAGLKVHGVPVTRAAFALGVLFGSLTPLLLWRLGVAAGRSLAGLLAALFLALFPLWWYACVMGMETTLACALILIALLGHVRRRAVLAALACVLLMMTRPDAASLPVLLFLDLLVRDRRGAVRFAVAGGLGALPWLGYATAVFGSPVPASLAAKRLIHHVPFRTVLVNYLSWFSAVELPWGMIALLPFWGIGTAVVLRARRALVVPVLWPLVNIVSVSFTEIGPGFWYGVVYWPVYFLVVFVGLAAVAGRTAQRTRLAWAIVLVPGVILGVNQARTISAARRAGGLGIVVSKERAYLEMAECIRDRARALGLKPEQTRIYAGEVGAIAYGLLDFEVIDSSGINSPEQLADRQRDWELLRRRYPDANPRALHRGARQLVLRMVDRAEPDFIASDVRYMTLEELTKDPQFLQRYRRLRSWDLGRLGQLLVLERVRPPE